MAEEPPPNVDLLIVGGGINGVGIARDAAGRGLSVLLVEKDDLAAHTSSSSSKLIHGGLRYLEQLDLRLVRESLAERERLLAIAPHIVRPIDFVMPMGLARRPAWLMRLGLFLYDHIGGRRSLAASRSVQLDGDALGAGLKPGCGTGLVYADCRTDDARLVVLNAVDAAERGAAILTRTEFLSARRERGAWVARLRGKAGEREVKARMLVNAAGPWVADLLARIDGAPPPRPVRLVKGSHIVVPRLHAGDHALLLQNPDGRVVFAIPFEGAFTLVGTTEVDWAGVPERPQIGPAEVDYLLATLALYFEGVPEAADIAWSYSGIRTLADDGRASASKVTRDYVLDAGGEPPLLSVYGGKLTTYRRLAEQALKRLGAGGRAWTADTPLPGGEVAPAVARRRLEGRYPKLPLELLDRLAAGHGTRAERLLGDAQTVEELGEHFGAGLHACEVDYLLECEWARTPEDILWRRTKLGLRITPAEARRLAAYLAR